MLRLLLWLKSRPWLVACGAAALAMVGMIGRLWLAGRKIVKLETANDRARVDKDLEDERAATATEKAKVKTAESEWIRAAERGAAAKKEQEDAEQAGKDRARRWGAKP